MITQVVLTVLGLVCASTAYPRAYQGQRQFYYPQQLQLPQQLLNSYQGPTQRLQFQVPAATQLLPNNVNTGMRYGQHQLVYVVPAGSQVIFDEQSGQEGGGEEGGVVEGVINLWNGVSNYFPTWSGNNEKPAEGGSESAVAEKPTETKPEKVEQKPQKPVEETSQQQEQQQQQLQQQQLQQQQQQQRYYLFGQPQQFYNPRPAVAAPTQDNVYYQNFPQRVVKPGSAAFAFQRLLQREGDESKPDSSSTTTSTGAPNEEDSSNEQNNEELGPSIAQAKPQAVSVAGPGGVAAAAPVGTAIVGPGGMALSAPTATAVAGTKPGKPQDKDKIRSYFPRTSYYPY